MTQTTQQVPTHPDLELEHGSRFLPDRRLVNLRKRRDSLSGSHKRDLYCDNDEFLIYHWSGVTETFAAATGENAASEEQRVNIGDHSCRVDVGGPFPYADRMPSKVKGYKPNVGNWAEDFAFFIRHSEAEVYPDEQIVGEFHWQLDEARSYKYPAPHADSGYVPANSGLEGSAWRIAVRTCQ